MNKDKREELQEQEEQQETAWQIFVRNYKNVEGFRVVTKFVVYMVLFFILVVAMNVTLGNKPKNATQQTTTTASIKTTYNNMLDRLLEKKSYSCKASINDKEYIIHATYGNKILTGTIESTEGIKSFKISDTKTYEVVMDQEVESSEVLKDINYNVVMNDELVAIIKNSKSTKLDGYFKYTKVNINDTLYEIDVYVDENNITGINVTSDNYKYEIKYDE